MLQRLAHRGSAREALWHAGPVSLGQCTLPERPAVHPHQPARSSSSGPFVLCADARIDNREELLGLLNVPGPSSEVTDEALILEAYATWGEACPAMLLGDFAFALWDEAKQHLFCARDAFGVRPFYYHASPRAFVFGSEIKALLADPRVPRTVHEERIADYLAGLCFDSAYTFYQGILRLPPGHTLCVGADGLRTRAYWSLDPDQELNLGSDEAYAEAFRTLFEAAVTCRLRSASTVGTMLSGGLDSSSVACIMDRMTPSDRSVPTFSSIFERISVCDERPFIEAVLAHGRFEPYFVDGDTEGPLQSLRAMVACQDEPFAAPNAAMTWHLYGAVRQRGLSVALDGFGGDETVSHGLGYLNELGNARRWLTLARELHGLARTFDDSFPALLWGFALKYGPSPLHTFGRRLSSLRRRLPGGSKPESPDSAPASPGAALIEPGLAGRLRFDERYRAWRRTLPGAADTERAQHYRTLTSPLQPTALEILNKIGMAFSVEPRFPFWDRRLVSFCLALPAEQKLHRGRSRMILRRAMQDVLPPPVLQRRTKTNFLPNLTDGVCRQDRDLLDTLLADVPEIEAYVNRTALQSTYDRLTRQAPHASPQDLFAVWRVATLATWLDVEPRPPAARPAHPLAVSMMP